MTDEMTTGPVPYPQPALRVAATYHASDGRVPEEIVLEFGGDGPVKPELVDRAVHALAGVADLRHYTVTPGAIDTTLMAAIRRAADATRVAAHEVAQIAAGAVLVDTAQVQNAEVAS